MKITTLIGDEPKSSWQRLADQYQAFALEEGVKISINARALQCAVSAQNPGYQLTNLEGVGLIAWVQHADHVLEILDLYIEPNHRRRGRARFSLMALIEQTKARSAIVSVAATNRTGFEFYRNLAFQKVDASLVFAPNKPSAGTKSYYDVECDRWLPATWPKLIGCEDALQEGLSDGGLRFWFTQGMLRDFSWPIHTTAVLLRYCP